MNLVQPRKNFYKGINFSIVNILLKRKVVNDKRFNNLIIGHNTS